MISEELIERFVEIGYEPCRQYRTVLDARRRAPAQIQLVLSAVRDGELELPNEAARIWSAKDSSLLSWMEGWIAQGIRSFIALRKEEKK